MKQDRKKKRQKKEVEEELDPLDAFMKNMKKGETNTTESDLKRELKLLDKELRETRKLIEVTKPAHLKLTKAPEKKKDEFKVIQDVFTKKKQKKVASPKKGRSI